ncbi:hypothetical protein RSOLAG1IB_11064 [Rhizoctonia solani AG-1 IB]|uniref:Uncharacterized protein n=1 Tax=Thanatephorus cucumeris (strain AG1-IB / isolate 7/3/14) TaxID=1108050 RepID=A0A0B7G2A0_THACB|nr:hypothetical protein RSOLAG1IB_11064 [Rhizoctonia solani AG-1 IB]
MFLPLFGGGLQVSLSTLFTTTQYTRNISKSSLLDPSHPSIAWIWHFWPTRYVQLASSGLDRHPTHPHPISYWPFWGTFLVYDRSPFPLALQLHHRHIPHVRRFGIGHFDRRSTVVRSASGSGFLFFAIGIYERLNPRIASTVLGAMAAAATPIPFVLKKYGAQVQHKSKYAPL